MNDSQTFFLSPKVLWPLLLTIVWITVGVGVLSFQSSQNMRATGMILLGVIILFVAIEGRLVRRLAARRLLKTRGYIMLTTWILIIVFAALLYLVLPANLNTTRLIVGIIAFGSILGMGVTSVQLIRTMKNSNREL
jgi:hypothetical protein